ncbi:hypothetical protein GOC29_32105, partial [Sinorhizobium meliloti]|nr:hypothetical protein [Sinorhizobium meliloti]
RGRLFLGIGGRDHFGIRGRIASEFATRASKSASGSIYAPSPCLRGRIYAPERHNRDRSHPRYNGWRRRHLHCNR